MGIKLIKRLGQLRSAMEVQEETPPVVKLSLPDLTTIDKSSQG